MVRDRTSSFKIDYVIVIKKFLNPKGHQNPISGHFTEGIDLAHWWSFIRKGLRLQPAQQAFVLIILILSVKVIIYAIFIDSQFGTLVVLSSLDGKFLLRKTVQ